MPNRFARSLRTNATGAERLLWQQLRLLKSEGRHIRRQVPIAGYVADFACHAQKLVIELDGGQHGEAQSCDAQRTEVLAMHGYRVIRFWNTEVFETLEGVVDRIRHELGLPTAFDYFGITPTPPHKGEGKWSCRAPPWFPSPLWGGAGVGVGGRALHPDTIVIPLHLRPSCRLSPLPYDPPHFLETRP